MTSQDHRHDDGTADDGAPGDGATAVVMTQAATAEALAAACAMSKADVDAVPTPIGALAVCRSTAPGSPERVAMALSRLLAGTPVVLVTHRAGQLRAHRWSEGAEGDELAPGLVLDGAPPELEQLLLGQVRAADLPGTVTSVGMSRWRATRALLAVSRAARRR